MDGILTILQELKVGKVYISKQIEKSDNYEKFLEIINDKKGKPNVQINTNILDKSLIKNIDISISHCKEYATAVCIIEINN